MNRREPMLSAEKSRLIEGVLHNAPFAIALTDNDGRITTVNRIFEELFRYSNEEANNQTLDFISIDNDDKEPGAGGPHDEHLKVYSVCKRRRKDGRPVEVELFTAPNIVDGKQLGYLVFYHDLSKRRKSEADPPEPRKEYLEILDSLQDGYIEVNKKGIITYVNLPFTKELGFHKKEEVIGKPFWDFIQKEFKGDVSNRFRTIYKTREPLEYFETKFSGNEGKTFIGEASVSPVFDGGKVVGTKGTIRNITLRFEAGKELAVQKDFLDALLEQTPIAVVNVNKENKIAVVNPAFQKLFGYSQEELIGKNLDDLLSSPEILEEMQAYSKNPAGERLYITGQRKKRDGTMTEVEVFAQPFFVGSHNYGHLVFYNDISDRLKAEADLRNTTTAHKAVLDTLQDSYFEADSAGYLTYVNQKFIESTKYTSKEELIGKHFRHLVAINSRSKFLTEFKKLFASNIPLKPFDLQYLTKDGAEFSSEIVASAILENGRTVGTRGIIRDISIRVKAEEILRKAKEAAEMRAGELASINRVAEKVSYSLDLQDILNTVCKELTKIFPIRNAGISLVRVDKSSLEVLAFHTIYAGEESQRGNVIVLEGNAELQNVISAKNTIVTHEVQSDLRTIFINELPGESDSRSIMMVPLVVRGEAIGFIGMTIHDSESEFSMNNVELAETVASQIATAIDNAQMHAQTERALDMAERDLEIGSEIQLGFFPKFLPEIPGWEISTYFKAARQVSGDFYDVFPIGETPYFGIVVADVCDKGVGAALFMVLLRSLIRSNSEQFQKEIPVEEMLLHIAVKVNNYIVNTHGQSNMFATLVLSILDPGTNKLYYVNGGHDAPVLVGVNGLIKKELVPTGPAFGFSTELSFEVGVIKFSPGDLLLSFTDGFTEARDLAGNFYTDKRFLKESGRAWPSAFSAVKHLEADVFSFIGDQLQFDDITLVALRRVMNNKPLYHSLTHKAEMTNLSLFRNFVVEACQLMKIEKNICETFQLAVDEVCSNLILHGYKDMEPGNIHVSVKAIENEILVQVEDTGHAFDPSFIDPPNLSDDIDERKIGGLGVFIVKEMVDEIHYESKHGRNCLSLKMRY